MPEITAKGKVFRTWDAVLGACNQNPTLLPGVEGLKNDLEGFLVSAKDLKIQQETLEGQRMAITQRLQKAIEDGSEVVRKIRAFAVVHLGSDSKHLSQFGVSPRQRRAGNRKTKKLAKQPPATKASFDSSQTPETP